VLAERLAIIPAFEPISHSGTVGPAALSRSGSRMCGIVGILGTTAVAPKVLEALRRLEYRGYDSAGVATLEAVALARKVWVPLIENVVASAAETVEHIVRGTMYAPMRRTPLLRSKSAASI